MTSRKVEERLQAELQTDVSLRVDPTDSPDKWTVSGRGELHLSILIETMRREGYELQVSRQKLSSRKLMVSNVNHLSAYKSTHQKNTKDLLSKAFLNVKVKCWIWSQLVTVKLVWSSLFQRVG